MYPGKESVSSSATLHSVLIAVLAVMTVVLYSNTFNVPFVFDDLPNIVDNKSIRINNIGIAELQRVAESGVNENRIVPYISFALNYYFHGFTVSGYHAVNLIIHALSTIVLYFLFFLTLTVAGFRGRNQVAAELSFIAAVVWMVHPLQTNTVTYIVQRMTGLAAFFFFLSLLLYLLGRLSVKSSVRRISFWILSFICWSLALLSKEISVMLPLVIVLYEFYFFGENKGIAHKKVIWLVALTGFLLILSVTWVYTDGNLLHQVMKGYEYRDFTLDQRLFTETRVLFTYLGLIFVPLPSRLNFNHDYIISQSFLSPPSTVLACIGLCGLVGLIIVLYKKNRILSFGLLWFLINLVVESSVIPLEIIFEHRVYLPSSMLLLAVVVLTYQLTTARILLFRSMWLIAIILLCIFTWQRNVVWSSPVLLWSDVVSKSPGLERGYEHLSHAYLEEGSPGKAYELCKKAIKEKVESPRIYGNWGKAALDMGQIDTAVVLLEYAISLDYDIRENHYNLGLAYGRQGRAEEARKEMLKGMQMEKKYR